MENPSSWGTAERIVAVAIRRHEEAMRRHLIGLSLIRTITDALREAGLLKDDADAT